MAKKVLFFKVHTPNLLQEILSNMDGSGGRHVMTIPLQTFARLLWGVATRAAELNDPQLNKLMWQLTLYRPRKRQQGVGVPNSAVVPKGYKEEEAKIG